MMTNCVIDISHHNGHLDLVQAAKAGIQAVILKATQGREWSDPLLFENTRKVRAAGLLLGAYHFATGDDVNAQVNHFLITLKALAPVVPVLDFERNTTPSGITMATQQTTMTLQQARDFVTEIVAATGKPPVLYTGGAFMREQLGGHPDPVLSVCPLWLAAYSATPHLPPGWDNFLMWQYTDGRVGPEPHTIPGIGPLDRSYFNSDLPQVTSWWNDNAWDGIISAQSSGIIEAEGDGGGNG